MLRLGQRAQKVYALTTRAFSTSIDEKLDLWKKRATKEIGGKDPYETLLWDTPDVCLNPRGSFCSAQLL
jgi:hypothetical protein